MNAVLIISPHLDDAVLSCGATIASLAAAGREVVIATVFTHTGENATAEDEALYARRRQDDKDAIQLLGGSCMHLSFTDAPFRSSDYYDFNTILFHHTLPAGERQLAKDVTHAIQHLIDTIRPDTIWFPLGVGGHIDHHIVYESSRHLVNQCEAAGYYDDLPYALVAQWNIVRWHQLGALPIPGSDTKKVKKTKLTDTSLVFISGYMHTWKDWVNSIMKYNGEWNDVPAMATRPGHWFVNDIYFGYDPVYTSEECFRLKCKAIACYTTEWPVLFGEREEYIAQTLAARLREQQYKEVYWSKLNNAL